MDYLKQVVVQIDSNQVRHVVHQNGWLIGVASNIRQLLISHVQMCRLSYCFVLYPNWPFRVLWEEHGPAEALTLWERIIDILGIGIMFLFCFFLYFSELFCVSLHD